MSTSKYTFDFDAVTSKPSKVRVICNNNTAETIHNVFCDDDLLPDYYSAQKQSILIDILHLAIAINFADKVAKQKKESVLEILITLPLYNVDLFDSVKTELSKTMYWFTGDNWSFSFAPHNKQHVSIAQKGIYHGLDIITKPDEVALWSGGLDSLAGLLNRFADGNKKFLLVGTGSHNIMRSKQSDLYKALTYQNKNSKNRLSFLHFPLKIKYARRIPKNKRHRARGIVFLLIGSAVALSNGQNILHIYENGIGAINLPYPGGIGRDHSKAVHPISLIRVANLISSLTQQSFSIINPFCFLTKAQMCEPLPEKYGVILNQSISCDQLRHEKNQQCGYCSSCLLRKQAFITSGIKDKTNYAIPHIHSAETKHYEYLNHMQGQVNLICQALQEPDPWYAFASIYPDDLPLIVSMSKNPTDSQESLLTLYRTYVKEWTNSWNLLQETLNSKQSMQRYATEEELWTQLCLMK